MMKLHRSGDRFHSKIDWLDSRHSFSFGSHYDPKRLGFGPLRVINEDWIAGGGGFPTHPHSDMEIITIVLEGALQHRDSTGGGGIIHPGDVQKMSAGSGIRHSEFNASANESAHLLQIWIEPSAEGVAPSYEQVRFEPDSYTGKLGLVASGGGEKGAIALHQDARLFLCRMDSSASLEYRFAPSRLGWIQQAAGKASVGGIALEAGDGLEVKGESALVITPESGSLFLFFDLPA